MMILKKLWNIFHHSFLCKEFPTIIWHILSSMILSETCKLSHSSQFCLQPFILLKRRTYHRSNNHCFRLDREGLITWTILKLKNLLIPKSLMMQSKIISMSTAKFPMSHSHQFLLKRTNEPDLSFMSLWLFTYL